nr:serine/threonine protein kinase [Deltaproteobacteria bacterium]
MSTAGAGAATAAVSDTPDVLPAGAKCGPWVIEREIGRGGMGAVYAVVHEDIGKRAALKIVHRRLLTPAFNIDRVMLEAKVVNAVGHPNIVDIFETGKLEDGRPYVVMERLEGQPLSYRADEGKILSDQVVAILLQVCDALIAAHASHIVHRDLKLDNVFLVDNVEDPGVPKVKLIDWGIAKVINHDVRHTIEGQLVGTPQYLSPEQARGADVTPQTDVHSLGVMAYELFLEQLPFEAETSAEIMAMHLRAIPPAPSELWPDIPQQLEDLILLMLAKNPENRPTMLEVARRLEAVGAELMARRDEQLALATGTVSIEAAAPITGAQFRRPSTGGSRIRVGSDGLRARLASEGLSPSQSRRRPSAGLAPTEPADSIDWQPKRKRWQFAIGAAALVASAMMFLLSRTGDTPVADAAARPAVTDTQSAAPIEHESTAPVATAPVAPANLAVTVMT